MKGPEMILGYVEYDGMNYPFVYEGGVLTILPSTVEEWRKQKANLFDSLAKYSESQETNDWISTTYIKGTTNKMNSVLFISNSQPGNDNGFIQYEIVVVYEYQTSEVNGDLIEGLIITADEIDYFYDPARVFNSRMTLNEITVMSGRDKDNTVKLGSYCYEDITVNVEVSAYSIFATRSQNPLSAQSQICCEFDKAIDLDSALAIIHHHQTFLHYICYRDNINIKNIDVIKRNDRGLRTKKGSIYIISDNPIETNKSKKEQILSLNVLEQNVIPILEDIAKNKVYCEHFCGCIDDRNSYNLARIILIFAAFEREYNNFYSSNSIRSERYFKVKSQVLSLLNSYKDQCTGKEKKYVSDFIKIVDNSDNSLGERIKSSINACIDIIGIFLKYCYNVVDNDLTDNIAKRMNAIRNHIAHGNLNLVFQPEHLSDFRIMEILIYVIRLKSLNIKVSNIQKSICQLFGYKIYIPEESLNEHTTL